MRLVPERLVDPIRWKKPKKIFVNSMSDLFHDGVPDEYIEKVCEVMLAANWHEFQVLTKRPERMFKLLNGPLQNAAQAKHIIWGVSVEDRKYGLPRIELLRNSGAVNTFLSIEPLLEDLGEIDLTGMSWVIVGGESGPGARPIEVSWVRSIHRQCSSFDVPFFFKQWGGTRKKMNGRLLDGQTYDEFPCIEVQPVPANEHRHDLLNRLDDF